MLDALQEPAPLHGGCWPVAEEDARTFELAVTELKLLSDFIARQEDIRLRIRGWNLALISGLTVAQASDELSLSAFAYLILGLGILLTGWFIEAWHAMAQFGGILRNHQVEEFLQGKSNKYEGPALGTSMRDYTHRDLWLRFLPAGIRNRRCSAAGRLSLMHRF